MLKGRLSSADFLRWARDYVGPSPNIYEVVASNQPGPKLGLHQLKEHRFYLFDADACHAVSHAIEALALEHATGHVVSLLGDFADFDSHHECYSQLAATIQSVAVLGLGRAPRVKGLQIRQDPRARIYRGIAYVSDYASAAFLCKALSARGNFFGGFFSVTPRVVHTLASELENKQEHIREFARLEQIDHTARELDSELRRQRTVLDTALQRLQTDPRYSIHHFDSDVAEGLASLSDWKPRLSVDQRRKG